MKTLYFKKPPKIQHQGSIVVDVPVEKAWPLIADSKRLEEWGPPVESIEIRLMVDQEREGVGSQRRVYAKFNEKRKGWYEEVRTEHIEGRKISFLIFEDSFGMSSILEDVGGSMEVVPEGDHQTRFIFTFCHRPKNFKGWLLNPLIKMDQKKNRNAAMKSFKDYLEGRPATKY